MPFDWTDYITFSEDLLNSRSDEASLRSAISRAYYGAFGKIRPYCTSRFNISSKKLPDVHRTLIDHLKNSSDQLEYATGNYLSDLRESRNDADYDSHSTINKPLVKKALDKSKLIVENLKVLKASL